uniref:Zinc-ribbon domain-containing protein n=1 Tax=viral metagenome TaxID=1070528 RepID=A0A6M3IDF3_9ZZZZ
MVYKSNFVVSVKCNGKILREFKESDNFVKLPFGSEYSILLKNLESRSAVVSISIDGKDVLDGDKLIIESNKQVELEGFKKKNKVTNRFKFIEKTEEISNHRGDRIDDGIIRIEYTFEKLFNYSYYWPGNWHYLNYSIPCNWDNSTLCSLTAYATGNDLGITGNDLGITVKGSDEVDQSFVRSNIGILEENSNVITLMLRGYKGSTKVSKPITVKAKITCETCGKKNRSYNKYCSSCGTCVK